VVFDTSPKATLDKYSLVSPQGRTYKRTRKTFERSNNDTATSLTMNDEYDRFGVVESKMGFGNEGRRVGEAKGK
jgi:hypothetical protein